MSQVQAHHSIANDEHQNMAQFKFKHDLQEYRKSKHQKYLLSCSHENNKLSEKNDELIKEIDVDTDKNKITKSQKRELTRHQILDDVKEHIENKEHIKHECYIKNQDIEHIIYKLTGNNINLHIAKDDTWYGHKELYFWLHVYVMQVKGIKFEPNEKNPIYSFLIKSGFVHVLNHIKCFDDVYFARIYKNDMIHQLKYDFSDMSHRTHYDKAIEHICEVTVNICKKFKGETINILTSTS
jgi:hypothetical protein